jgi:lipoate-protein ligase A
MEAATIGSPPVAAKTFRVIRSGALPGARNMALDEALSSGPSPEPTLRLYRWDPWTLSLGWFQRPREEDLAPFLRARFGVTRRSTGGGAILHGDELTYSVVLPAEDPRIPGPASASYDWLHAAVREALAAVGVEAEQRGGEADGGEGGDPFFCFARTAPIDLVAGGRKIAGSAQRRTRTAFLQHGSIPLSPNGTAPGATSVGTERGSPADPAALEDAMARGFARVLGAEAVESSPTPEEEARATALERGRYGDPAWVLRPWGRRKDRAGSGDFGPAPAAPIAPPAPTPLHVLRAEVGDEALRVRGSVGGATPSLPHARLRAADAALFRRVRDRALAVERDPWDSTFRRSHFADARGEAGAEGFAPARIPVEEAEVVLLLRYAAPAALLRLDLRRLNYRDLGSRATGDPTRDARTLLGTLAARAAGAAAGPGALALLAGASPPLLADEATLRARVEVLGAGP